jgi:hypothetical protein
MCRRRAARSATCTRGAPLRFLGAERGYRVTQIGYRQAQSDYLPALEQAAAERREARPAVSEALKHVGPRIAILCTVQCELERIRCTLEKRLLLQPFPLVSAPPGRHADCSC